MIAKILDLNGEIKGFEDVDRVSLINAESYGNGVQAAQVDRGVLLLNVTGFAAVKFE